MTDVPEELARLRGSIDNLDEMLVRVLAERFKVTHQIGLLKAERSLPATDPAREAERAATVRRRAVEAGLDPEIAESVLRLVIAEASRRHRLLADARATWGPVRSTERRHRRPSRPR